MCCALSNVPWNKKKGSLFNYELMHTTRLAGQKSNRTIKTSFGNRTLGGVFSKCVCGGEFESRMSSESDSPPSRGPIKIYQMVSDLIENSPSELSLVQ